MEKGGYVGSKWAVLGAEGKHQVRMGKKHMALDTFNKAVETPGCGWSVIADRADCKLRLLDFQGALQDAQQAMDSHHQEQPLRPAPAKALMTAVDALRYDGDLEEALVIASRLQARHRGASLIGDERAQRLEGMTADIRDALGPDSSRVLREDLVRDMLRSKGINPERLMAGPHLSWVAVSSVQVDKTATGDSPPLPLPIIWGATPLDVAPPTPEEVPAAEGEAEQEEQEEERDAEDEGEGGEVQQQPRRVHMEGGEVEEERGWGWLQQIPGHDHLCADPLVAAQAERICELRVLGLLEHDRAFLRRLYDELETEQERPGARDVGDGGCECPGPNLSKWQQYSELLRAESLDEKGDPLAASKWEAQDVCKDTIEKLNHLVRSGIRSKGRYQLQSTALKSASRQMQLEVRAARRDRALSTVHFMLRRVHDLLRSGQDRDVEHVGARLIAYLEKLPCRIFQDRLLAMARTLDCRAVAARRRRNYKLAIEMQKRRCRLASEHGLPQLYVRALDEMALFLFAVADYPLAETSWNERLSRLEKRDAAPEQRAQTVFQLARCCYVQGFLRVAGRATAKQLPVVVRKDHRSALPRLSRGQHSSAHSGRTLRSSGSLRTPRSLSQGEGEEEEEEGEEEEEEEEEEERYECEWSKDRCCRWTPDMFGVVLEEQGEEPLQAATSLLTADLKPNSMEACLRIIMGLLDTQDPLNDYADLLSMERFPDEGDAGSTYPFMPPDFDEYDNVMNKEYEEFERRFRDACQLFVGDINGGQKVHDASAGEPEAKKAKPEVESEVEPEVGPEVEPEVEPGASRLPSLSEEQEEAPEQTQQPEEDTAQ